MNANNQSTPMTFWHKARLAQIGIVNAPFILLGVIVLIIILLVWALKQPFIAKNQGLCGGWSGPTTFPLFMRNNPVAGQPDIWWLPTDYDNGPWINRMLF